MTKSKCIFVTGAEHSGTRMLVEMFDKHPDVSVPMAAINEMGEFRPWNPFFVEVLDRTPLYSEEYVIDREELRFILDAYMQSIDTSKAWFVLKEPYHPLNHLDAFVDYFDGEISLVFTKRPPDKIFRSYQNRGEDRRLFSENSLEQLRHVKKLPVAHRYQHLAHPDAETYFKALVAHCDTLRERWDAAHPDRQFVVADMETIATSKTYLVELLEKLDLPRSGADAMMTVIDPNRLLHHQPQNSHSQRPSLKTVARGITPPAIWNMAARLKKG
jgi:hypothetical protein